MPHPRIVDSSALAAIENIPAELRACKGWLVWRLEPGGAQGKKPLKVPYYTDGTRRRGEQGGALDRARLATWDEAVGEFSNGGGWSGLGLAMLADWGLVGLDFDDCFEGTGELRGEVVGVVGGTYAERSPSGFGVHAFVRGSAEDRKSRAAPGKGWLFGFETFCSTGFLTMTGDVLEGVGQGTGVAVANGALDALVQSRWGTGAVDDLAWGGWRGEGGEDGARGAGQGLDAVLLSALAVLNAGGRDLEYDEWILVLFALHHETGGGEQGRVLAHEVSSRSTLYDPANVDYQWSRAHSEGRARVVGRGTILELARGPAGGGWSDAVLLDTDAFAVVPAAGSGVGGPGAGSGAPLDLPPFKRDAKGRIEPTADNAVMALRRADVCGWRMGHESFTSETYLEVAMDVEGNGFGRGWRPMVDEDLTRLRIRLEQAGFKTVSKELVRDAALLVASENVFDSAQVWLGDVVPAWDGVERIDRFLVDRFGVEDDAAGYARAVGRYLWTALAGRVLKPGEWVDMVPVLIGAQGLGKSKALCAMVPDPRFCIEMSLTDKDDDAARRMRGVLIVELAELHGLRARDMDGVKRFITRTHENWVPKYREAATTYARRCVMVGTANRGNDGFLGDETGERRWLPVDVTRADVAGIAGDRLQLWAEGREAWRGLDGRAGAGGGGGVAWEVAERLAGPAREANALAVDDWEGPIGAWLASANLTTVSGAEVASSALGIAPKDLSKNLQMRIAAILCKSGFERQTVWHEGQAVKRWAKK